MQWEPKVEGLTEICQLLGQAQESDNATHTQIYNVSFAKWVAFTRAHSFSQRLEAYNEFPDFNNYLVYILSHVPDAGATVRAGAGLLLKKNVAMGYMKLDPAVQVRSRCWFFMGAHTNLPPQHYIKQHVVNSIGDEYGLIRAAVGINITTIVQVSGLENWPGLLVGNHILGQNARNNHHASRKGSVGCWRRMMPIPSWVL